MKSLLYGLAALPFLASVGLAGQPLNDQQMDRVTAGFTSSAQADAQGVVGESALLLTTAATLAEVAPLATLRLGETSSTLFKSLAASQSSSATTAFTVAPVVGP